MTKEEIERKTDDEIRIEIISACWSPMARSVESLRKLINSNWFTIRKYADELADAGILERIKVENQTVGFKVNHLFKMSVANAYSNNHEWIDLGGEIPKEYPIKNLIAPRSNSSEQSSSSQSEDLICVKEENQK